MSKWISWDFDDTLYDPYSGQLIGQTYKIFKNQLKSGAKLCITTYSTKMNVKLLKNYFQIFQFLQLEENLKLSY